MPDEDRISQACESVAPARYFASAPQRRANDLAYGPVPFSRSSGKVTVDFLRVKAIGLKHVGDEAEAGLAHPAPEIRVSDRIGKHQSTPGVERLYDRQEFVVVRAIQAAVPESSV